MGQKIRHIDPDKLWQANADYIERIERDGVSVVYDATLDTLFIEFGGPKEALSEHAKDNIMLRIDPETLQIVGYEIVDFLSDFLPHNRLVGEMVREWGLEGGKDFRVTLMEPRFKNIRGVLEALFPPLAQSVGG